MMHPPALFLLFALTSLVASYAQEPNPRKGEWKTRDDCSAIYEFVYPHNAGVKENHYIVLVFQGRTLRGRYYGTSDEFDEGREGYLPGFFVTEMLDLQLRGDSIKFRLKIDDGDLFTQPIRLNVENSAMARGLGYESWDVKMPNIERSYIGMIRADTMLIKGDRPSSNKLFVLRPD